MKRLFQISLDTILISILPIIMWILLGIILTKDISNVFSLTYPLQFFFMVFLSIFSKGANITAKKENDQNIVYTNTFLGMVIVGVLVILLGCNVDAYINFMSMDPNVYRIFCIYSIVWLYFCFILQMIVEKMYFDRKNGEANRACLILNLVNFILILFLSSMIKPAIAVTITLVIDAIILILILVKNLRIGRMRFCIKKNIRYSSFDILRNLCMFLTYGLGMSRSFTYGEQFIIATNFESLTTDTQWDVLYSVNTVSRIDLAENRFDYKESLKNAYKLLAILLGSTILLNVLLYPFYKPDLKILLILLAVQFIDMVLDPLKTLRMSYLQINDTKNVGKHNLFMLLTRFIRVCCSFIPSAFCTYISQFVSMVCLFLYSFIQCRGVPLFKLKAKRSG